MREIKFRAWDVNASKMLEAWQLSICEKRVFVQKVKFGDGEPRNVNLMQYTGLKDKNGKEIYEGDIIEYIEENTRYTSKVDELDENGYSFESSLENRWVKILSDNTKGPIADDEDCELDCNELEVVGNIYENPKLLSKDK